VLEYIRDEQAEIVSEQALSRIFRARGNCQDLEGHRIVRSIMICILLQERSVKRMISSRRTRWAGHVAQMARKRIHIRVSSESEKEIHY
jgi:hypothetical protein